MGFSPQCKQITICKQNSFVEVKIEKCKDDEFLANEKVIVGKQLHIPNHLYFSILSKLPVKSLKRFVCVRKSWSLLFDNTYFMTLYRNHFLTKDHSYYDDASVLIHQTFCPWDGYYWDATFELYCVSGERFKNRVKLDWPSVKLDPIDSDKLEYDSGFNIIGYGSVNGVLCLFCLMQVNIILWNPSTKEFKLIPPSPLNFKPYEFGYDCLRDDYKVMCHGEVIRETDCDLDTQSGEKITYVQIWEIYSLRTNSWKKLDVEIDHNPMYGFNHQVYIDGFSHWLCESEAHNEAYLMSFDWSNEVFVTTPISSNMDDIFDPILVWRFLVLLNGSIAVIVNYTESCTFHISILGELGVKESWAKIFIVGPLPYLEYPIGAGKKGDMLLKKKDGGIVWFDLNTQMIEDDLGIIADRFGCKIVIHKENLLPFEGNFNCFHFIFI